MTLLMRKNDLETFLKVEFPQVSKHFKILQTKPNSLSMLMHISDEHLRPGGTVSGPTMFMLADVSFYLATLSMVGPKKLTVTTNCSINFLRKPIVSNLISEARVLKIGKTLSVGDVLIYSKGVKDPVAHATLTYAIPRE